MAKGIAELVTEARARIREIAPEALQKMLTSGAGPLLIDIREADELRGGQLPGAHHIPRGRLEAAADATCRERDPQLSAARHRPVVLYCDSGARSALAALTLQEMGFDQVCSLAGGITLWEAEELPLSRGEAVES